MQQVERVTLFCTRYRGARALENIFAISKKDDLLELTIFPVQAQPALWNYLSGAHVLAVGHLTHARMTFHKLGFPIMDIPEILALFARIDADGVLHDYKDADIYVGSADAGFRTVGACCKQKGWLQ